MWTVRFRPIDFHCGRGCAGVSRFAGGGAHAGISDEVIIRFSPSVCHRGDGALSFRTTSGQANRNATPDLNRLKWQLPETAHAHLMAMRVRSSAERDKGRP
ncbi:hypothetical protein FRACA_160023 [Frankia canadensis]|uniref:Uncharacterized protein n=1 Tax=Frankia canadensis TaxID=1836972 RepID=A0A2I2KMJ6_9ACTN|nr:hypothetical protein FRACA_160023 [Frankia canadensis]SOU54162.1 hypothetical protein FRACA_160023 [Frankia canadensis]